MATDFFLLLIQKMEDPLRPWIQEEKELFSTAVHLLAKDCGAQITDRMYNEGKPPYLAAHFECLDLFVPDNIAA
jgi:hypothetical protein